MRRFLTCALLLVVATAPARGAFREQAKIEAAYRRALGAWATGEDEDALAQLQRLDGEAAADGDVGRLERAKLAVGKALGRRTAASLLAAAALEERAYLVYASRRPTMAAEARRSAAALVELHASLDRAAAARAVDAAMLASLAGSAAAGAQHAAAEDLYDRVLALAPRQPAAVLGLAAIHELHAEYGEAVELLAPLVLEHPDAREARLRLAVNELRLGRRDRAEADLRALANDGVDWVRSLAAQELAKLLAARGDFAGAAAVLEAAAALLPCDPSLPVQTALVAERAGSATPLDLSTLGACGEAAESARARYTHAPSSELVPLRQAIATGEPEWRQALAGVLGVAAQTRVSE
ncbi:MAG TPA: hypothetical protein VGS57_21390 [Thermoanaerobaculia bacterium]|jgi:tetratricopeptide (TPR) repeat protein|nr:hypothetical protein [Thermoanaerobaculia bacterium]